MFAAAASRARRTIRSAHRDVAHWKLCDRSSVALRDRGRGEIAWPDVETDMMQTASGTFQQDYLVLIATVAHRALVPSGAVFRPPVSSSTPSPLWCRRAAGIQLRQYLRSRCVPAHRTRRGN